MMAGDGTADCFGRTGGMFSERGRGGHGFRSLLTGLCLVLQGA